MTDPPGVLIRDEQPADRAEVFDVNRAAFGRDAEAALVDRLRGTSCVIASRVAAEPRGIVGHILFAEVSVESGEGSLTVASLAPMAVRPDRQMRGIGTALVRDGIAICRARGYRAIVVVGHVGYYPRFGFAAAAVAHLDSPFRGPAFMGLDLVPGSLGAAAGRVRYPEAFAAF